MTRQHILDEIRRTAKANGGIPLGAARFTRDTGIRYYDWCGKYWARWSDALREAGFDPNILQGAYSDDVLMEKLVGLIRELGHFPASSDLRLQKRKDEFFPSHNVFTNHFGSISRLRQKVAEYCRTQHGFDDVVDLCGPIASDYGETPADEKPANEGIGFVYLMKYGRNYKIGKTNARGRREYELAIQLPEKVRTVHVIKTDDPDGIEAYWHKRFASKRGNGEWFRLDAADVQAFRRRKFM